MKEFFQSRKLTGTITINLSNKKKWVADKGIICSAITQTVESYGKQGYRLTLRQLYYQLVSKDFIPNDDVVYKKISSILDDLRYSGQVSWDAIEDRGRVPYIPYSADSPSDAIGDLIAQYRLDRMQNQDCMVEVWTEKDAISGILKRATTEYHVKLVVNKGYSSSSAMHAAYQRFADYINAGKKVKVLYFGDHDPSGLDMIRDVRERIAFFLAAGSVLVWNKLDVEWEWEQRDMSIYDLEEQGLLQEKVVQKMMSGYGGSEEEELFYRAQRTWFLLNYCFEVIPIGLTKKQIAQYNPPPNPAKITDPRAKWYIAEHGNTSWEVDALRPEVMVELVKEHILANIDEELYDAKLDIEIEHKRKMADFAKTFEN